MAKKEKYLKIVPKAWGEERWIVNNDYCGKILVLKKDFRCSYHAHKVKGETFYINKGKVLLEFGEENLKKAKKIILNEGESKLITPGLYHRFTGLVNSEIIEFSTTHDEKDSYRKTTSGRAKKSGVFEKMVNNFKNAKVLVVGDVMLDQYIFTKAQKISDEAPILIVLAQKFENVLGGAANACHNLKALNVNCGLISIIGRDDDGQAIKKLLAVLKIPTNGIFTDNRTTTKKTRIIAKNQQLIRLDQEDTQDISKSLESKIYKYFTKTAPDFDVVILSDYAKGILTHGLIRKIIDFCKNKKIKIIVDPAIKHVDSYIGVSAITPNLAEAGNMVGALDTNNIKEIGKRLQKKLNTDVVMTLGGQGMMIFEKNKAQKIKGISKEVYDVSGAGDTVVATIAAGLAGGSKLLPACKLANIAGAIKVGKFGTAAVSSQELMEELK